MAYRYGGKIFDAHLPWPPLVQEPRSQAACGTPSGYKRHRTLGEPTCDDCRQANTDYSRQHRRAKKVAA